MVSITILQFRSISHFSSILLYHRIFLLTYLIMTKLTNDSRAICDIGCIGMVEKNKAKQLHGQVNRQSVCQLSFCLAINCLFVVTCCLFPVCLFVLLQKLGVGDVSIFGPSLSLSLSLSLFLFLSFSLSLYLYNLIDQDVDTFDLDWLQFKTVASFQYLGMERQIGQLGRKIDRQKNRYIDIYRFLGGLEDRQID